MYQVAKKLRGAEKILLCMGYAPVTTTSTNEIQELKYGGEVNTERVVYTAADLVILHSELDRIADLVTGAEQSNFRNVILRDILKARSEPEDTLDSTLRRALSWSLERIRQERGQVARPALYHHFSQAPMLPPRGAFHQQLSSNMAQLHLPVAQGGHSSLQHQGEYLEDISSGGRRSSAPSVQANLLEHRAPPPSPLFQSRGGEQQLSAAPPNSKDQYNKIDKTIDKSQIGIDSVGPRNTPDTCDTFIPDTCDTVVSPASKGGSIPFDPMNLPEPAFDTHDLEMLHQEARTPEDSYTSGMMSMLIDPRSTDYDFSGPDLDDHLTLRSHDSGHMGLSGSIERQIERDSLKNGNSEQLHVPGQEEEEETCVSSNILGYINVKAPRIREAYESIILDEQKDKPPSSSASFSISGDTFSDSQLQPSSTDAHQTEQPFIPQPRPRSSSGGPLSISERPPLPRPRSNQNLLSTQHLQTPPPSPGRKKPVAKPRTTVPKVEKSQESVVTPVTTLEDINIEITSTNTSLLSDKLQEKLTTIDEGAVISHVTSMDSNSSMPMFESEHDSNHFEATSSLESCSPHPSVEASASTSSKSDPCPSTSPHNASPACTGEKVLFMESSVSSSVGGSSWVNIDLTTKEQQHETCSSLDSQPRPRERCLAFSNTAKFEKPVKPLAESTGASKTSKTSLSDSLFDESLMYSQVSDEIHNAKPCWYCTNLTTNRKCEICGNIQLQNKETAV